MNILSESKGRQISLRRKQFQIEKAYQKKLGKNQNKFNYL